MELLKASSLATDQFSGRLVINLNQGGVTDVERIEIIELGREFPSREGE